MAKNVGSLCPNPLRVFTFCDVQGAGWPSHRYRLCVQGHAPAPPDNALFMMQYTGQAAVVKDGQRRRRPAEAAEAGGGGGRRRRPADGRVLGIPQFSGSTSWVIRWRRGNPTSRLLPEQLRGVQGSRHAVSDPVSVPNAVEKLMMALGTAQQIDRVIQARADKEKCKKRYDEGLQAAGEIAVLGELPKGPVKLQVVVVETLDIAALGGSLHGVHQALQRVEVLGRHVLNSQFHRQTFEFLPHTEDLLGVL